MKAFLGVMIFLLMLLPLTCAAGTWTTIDVPGSTHTAAYKINDAGQIVGFYNDSTYAAHGFLYSAGTFTTIDYPGSTGTYALGVNNSGSIVGVYGATNQGTHGFVFDGRLLPPSTSPVPSPLVSPTSMILARLSALILTQSRSIHVALN
jgi:probable HAF family extracellular repeat protein